MDQTSRPDTGGPPPRRPGVRLVDLVVVLALFVAWIALQAWVLPRMGVKT